jgi:hypothetical protein
MLAAILIPAAALGVLIGSVILLGAEPQDTDAYYRIEYRNEYRR